MGLSKYLLAFLFPLFSAFASVAIFSFSDKNGSLAVVEGLVKERVFPFAGGRETLRTTYTGIEAIDRTLTILTVFFTPVVDGSNVSLTLHSYAFSGLFGASWVLVLLESYRAGSSRKFLFPSIFGIAAQLFTYAVSAPLFFALQLLVSDVSFQPTAKNIAVPIAIVKALPVALLLTYTTPTLAMMLPSPEIVTLDQKQLLIALWHPWPAYLSFALTIVSLLSSNNNNSPTKLRASLRATYTFALIHGAIGHITAWTISLYSVAKPAFFNSEVLHSLHPSQVFGLTSPFSDFRVSSLSEGIHIFLQWDSLIGSSSILLWAAIVNVLAQRKVQGGRVAWPSFLFKIAYSLVFTGPIGTAVRLVWDRDELVLEEELLKSASKKAI